MTSSVIDSVHLWLSNKLGFSLCMSQLPLELQLLLLWLPLAWLSFFQTSQETRSSWVSGWTTVSNIPVEKALSTGHHMDLVPPWFPAATIGSHSDNVLSSCGHGRAFWGSRCGSLSIGRGRKL